MEFIFINTISNNALGVYHIPEDILKQTMPDEQFKMFMLYIDDKDFNRAACVASNWLWLNSDMVKKYSQMDFDGERIFKPSVILYCGYTF